MLSGRLPIPENPTNRQRKGKEVILEGAVEHLGQVRLGEVKTAGLSFWWIGLTLHFEDRHSSGLFQRLEIIDQGMKREVVFQLVDLDLSEEPPSDEVFHLQAPVGLECNLFDPSTPFDLVPCPGADRAGGNGCGLRSLRRLSFRHGR